MVNQETCVMTCEDKEELTRMIKRDSKDIDPFIKKEKRSLQSLVLLGVVMEFLLQACPPVGKFGLKTR